MADNDDSFNLIKVITESFEKVIRLIVPGFIVVFLTYLKIKNGNFECTLKALSLLNPFYLILITSFIGMIVYSIHRVVWFVFDSVFIHFILNKNKCLRYFIDANARAFKKEANCLSSNRNLQLSFYIFNASFHLVAITIELVLPFCIFISKCLSNKCSCWLGIGSIVLFLLLRLFLLLIELKAKERY